MDSALKNTQEALEQAIEQLFEALRPILEAVKQAIRIALEKLAPIIDIFKKFVAFFSNYPNKKVIYLSLYAKRKRVRDKNRNRIIRDFFISQNQLRSVEQ